MQSYGPAPSIDPATLEPFDTTAGGATRVDGDIDARVRIDFAEGDLVGGLFVQKAGRAEIVWPATEHAFVLEGEVMIDYLDSGETVRYRPGDGWIIRKGERIVWTVTTPRFVKSFFLRGQ